jgi:hypothetical protein
VRVIEQLQLSEHSEFQTEPNWLDRLWNGTKAQSGEVLSEQDQSSSQVE